MRTLRLTVILALASLALSACDNSPTAPQNLLETRRNFTAEFDPTLVTFNLATCSLSSTSTGVVICSWDISNAAQNRLNLAVEAVLDVSYDCVNPKNGRLHSSETAQIRSFVQQFGVSSTSLTGSNVALPPPLLATDFSGSLKKQNACKGNFEPANAVWSLDYWDIAVITTTGTQRTSCFASDNRNGCFTS